MSEQDAVVYLADKRVLVCQNQWNLSNLPNLENLLQNIAWPSTGTVTIDGQQIDAMDSAGAWLFFSIEYTLAARGLTVVLAKLSEAQSAMRTLITPKVIQMTVGDAVPKEWIPSWLTKLGMQTVDGILGLTSYLAFIGMLTAEAIRVLAYPSKWRLREIANIVYRCGYQALPIIAMLSFMIGVVITYQLGLQLRNYGANRYIVDLLGLAVLREFGPLITAIMVAGRTGSAFTAQLGTMKINQEIDALNTMGVTPAELLLLPRIIGLFIALPLLTFWADIFGLLGGMMMSNNMLQVTWHDFLHRFPRVIPLKTLFIGLGKAPLFALVIASVGCFQGMKVKDNTNQIGLNTTRSVVLSIFFIIVIDAVLSILFSKLKL
ncbi:MAG: hypothetical protein A3F43_05755 [Gammaproteobacteria bacterium RIFCSPHIGHO2_12_FULL_42_10]|nr:MAG: hypothetical protein A3F43_05755 [Gammaproteobacteria bacterium RIFCSPHIGHO2_12_FULL_42_10]